MLINSPLTCNKFNDEKWTVYCPTDGKYYLISNNLMTIISILQTKSTYEEAFENYVSENKLAITLNEFIEIIETQISFLLVNAKKTLENNSSQNKTYLTYKKELLTEFQTKHISKYFTFLFNKYFFGTSFLIMLISFSIIALGYNALMPNNDINIAVIAIFIYLSIIFHELGHIVAANKYKVEHKGMGFGFYLFYPVLYTDLTNAWTLNKYKRIVINLAGIFFQFIYSLLFFILFKLTNIANLYYIFYGVFIASVWQLMPFVRFDGYWILSDLIETPNLLTKSNYALLNLFKGNINFFKDNFPKKDYFYLGYGLLNNFIIVAYVLIISLNIKHEIVTYPVIFIKEILKLNFSFHMIPKVLTILIFYFMVYRLIHKIIQYKKYSRN